MRTFGFRFVTASHGKYLADHCVAVCIRYEANALGALAVVRRITGVTR